MRCGASLPLGACPPIIHRGVPRSFLAQGRPDRILARLGLDEDGVVRTVREALAELQHPAELRSPVDPVDPVDPRPAGDHRGPKPPPFAGTHPVDVVDAVD